MSDNKVHAVTDEAVLARNIVKALVQKSAWGKVEEIARGAGSGLTATEAAVHVAHEAIALRDKKVARRTAPRRTTRRPGPVVLSGPAEAGKHGGGKEAPPLPPTPSKKTNVGFWSKGTSVTKTAPVHDKDDKKKKKGKK